MTYMGLNGRGDPVGSLQVTYWSVDCCEISEHSQKSKSRSWLSVKSTEKNLCKTDYTRIYIIRAVQNSPKNSNTQ